MAEAIISTHLLQILSDDKPLGFARSGGTMRYYCSRLNLYQKDWYKTLDYAISRGWIEYTGQIDGAGKVYSWRGRDNRAE